jgi:hypothetical protein
MWLLVLVVTAAGCTGTLQQNLPPAERLMHPGPGVGGPGPGIMSYQPAIPTPSQTSQIAFVGPEGMIVTWDVTAPNQFDSEPLICPGRYNFPQGAIYRLKLTNIPGSGRAGVELYPTLEVGPAMPRTMAFLAHSAVPVEFSEEDFDQVLTGNFVTKVIYLPDPEYQEWAMASVGTVVSTRLEPGMDPIVEADRRGSILAIVRLGNKDEQIPTEMLESPSVVPASYGLGAAGQATAEGAPLGVLTGGMASPSPVNYVSGVTGPQYGMPMCGTPIGLPGPPHVPLGAPAGLRRHVMQNHTVMNVPEPTRRVKIDVRQDPGLSYPKPANHAWIVEQNNTGLGAFLQPLGDRTQRIGPESGPCDCPPTAEYDP